ncbi:hypothetical protein BKA62DRAFT_831353 [Auriculariales sp. MPI-PUGE-AT-0066]|nr:hypothetical protein BKA62DRAFT_831353 [Auriculariales sp. MPI-PUGE-AT-0066]
MSPDYQRQDSESVTKSRVRRQWGRRADGMSYKSDSNWDPSPNESLHDEPYSHLYNPREFSSHADSLNPGSASVLGSRGTLAAQPAVFDADEILAPHMDDAPQPPLLLEPASDVPDADLSLQRGAPNEGGIPDNMTTLFSAPILQALTKTLTPQQLNAVSAMINRGLPSSAVVGVIQAMLTENQDAQPYDNLVQSGAMIEELLEAPLS